jgi:SAM-dependent methyltransferase
MNSKRKPSKQVPAKLVYEYTIGNRVPIQYWYFDGTLSEGKIKTYNSLDIDNYLKKIGERKTFYYGITDSWLYQALEKFPVQDKDIAIMGSVEPLYESIAIYYGGRPTTIEYQPRISDDPRLRTVTVEEFMRHPRQFDAVFSISSFEHDGLGRYGDPLNPSGDLEAMEKMKSILKPNGLLFLSVPIGADTLVWNAHRVYGPLRLPLLLSGWKLLGFFPSKFPYRKVRDGSQPIFVLQNSITDDIRLKQFIRNLSFALALKRSFVRVVCRIRSIMKASS